MEALAAAFSEAAGGEGRLVLVYGEAGIGKTSLVESFVRERARTSRVLWGACDSLYTPRPLAPLYDIAEQAQTQLRARLDAGAPPALISRAVLEELGRSPPVITVLEDLHWADESTLDLVKFIGRRIQSVAALVVLTYRDDELGPRHPLRIVLGDLSTSGAVRRMPLAALSVAAVRTLAADQWLDFQALHRQSGGNPFFVTEALASRGGGIPATIKEAVLARAARLSSSGRAALDAASVIGIHIDARLLGALAADVAASVDECIDIGMLEHRGNALAFRHELARRAIFDMIAPPRRRELHARVLAALQSAAAGTADAARLAHYGEGAGDERAVLEHAPAAAEQAAAAGAHREAADQYARALRFIGRAPSVERARLLDAHATESAIVDRVDEAIGARREALDAYRALGERQKEAETLAALASVLVRAGHNAEAEDASLRAIAMLESMPTGPALARAYRIQAALRMLNRDRAEAVRWGRRAIALAERVGDRETVVMAYNTLGAAMLVYGDDQGRVHLERSLALARAAGLHEMVAGAFMNLGSAYGETYRFAEAERYLTAGIAYATERDLDASRHYMQSWLALTRLYQGRWTEAGDIAADAVERAQVSTTSRIMALVALGRLRARRGDPGVAAALDEALELANRTQTLQRLGPVRAARAEAAWLAGDGSRAIAEARAVWDIAIQHRHAWHAGELGYWRWRAGDRVRIPPWCARPFALHVKGDWRRAAAAWARLGCPYEHARALADGDQRARLAAVEAFDRIGARLDLERLRQQLRSQGVRRIPRGPRPSTRRNPFGLTAREAQIAALLGSGMSNARIGARLHISPKTVDHHVSAILAKLGVRSREEAGRLALEHGFARDA
jgi:DNA-binding CsgD family transcriptional regulator/tetratricopeptide (TPR) repeat protein